MIAGDATWSVSTGLGACMASAVYEVRPFFHFFCFPMARCLLGQGSAALLLPRISRCFH